LLLLFFNTQFSDVFLFLHLIRTDSNTPENKRGLASERKKTF
jgi:hypothetical protein